MEEGGLGLKDQEVWNKAMVGRLVNWIAEKRDSIWVQWVQCNYLRGRDWFEYSPSTNSSWVWRRICKVKQDLAQGFVDGVWVVQPTSWALPKHRFMGWLVAHEAMNTVDKLITYGMDVDACCTLCGQADESMAHLFFDCQYSRRVMLAMQQITSCSFPMAADFMWWANRGGTVVQKGVQIALFLGALYAIWFQRNKCRNYMVLMHPRQVVLQIHDSMKARIRGRGRENLSANDVSWLCHKNFM
ncbi:uncharacterized protein LOC141620331 [Silene latifolia]|uniref:uncharacterized protein LOC141620331 n=1 Tax=Silene latifolia TaxID=37657 RepID=UPI003D778E8F